MVLRKIALVLLYGLLAVAFSQAQPRTLHVVTFIATEDDQIGSHLKKTQENLDNWYADVKDYLSTYPDVKTQRWSFAGNKFQHSELVKFLKEFRPPTTDATLFWFVGHGVQDEVNSIKTPDVLVLPQRSRREADRKSNSINLQDIFDALHHQTDFLWFVGDACNSPMERRSSSGSTASQGIKAQGLGKAKNEAAMASNYYDLFFNSKEQKLFYDIKKGRQTYTTKSQGALYSHAFLRLLDQEMEGPGIPNTDVFHNKVLKEYEDLLTAAAEAIAKSNKKKRKKRSKATNTSNIKIDNPGLIKRIILTLFESKANRKLRKRYKKVLENGNLEEVGNLLPRPSKDGQESAEYKQFLRDNPTAYYLSMGLFKEYNADSREDSAYVGECYCTANEVLNRGMSTSKEFVLLNKIDKYNIKNGDPLDIAKAVVERNGYRKSVRIIKPISVAKRSGMKI